MIHKISYKHHDVDYTSSAILGDLYPLDHLRNNWIDIDDATIIQQKEVQTYLNLHPLVIQDILENGHLPKIELNEEGLFVILKIIFWDEPSKKIHKEQICLILKHNFILSFQEEPFIDAFIEVKNRLLSKQSSLNQSGIDAVFLKIISTIVNDYNKVIIAIQNEIDLLEQKVLKNHNINISGQILELKDELSVLKRHLFPTKEIIYELKTNGQQWISKSSSVYIQDIQDHILDTLSNLETLRESIKDLMDLQASLMNQQMNTIMKTLTIISVIFMPLNFIVGFYGMNIDTLPAVHWKWIMVTLLGIMFFISLLIVWYMKTKKWL